MTYAKINFLRDLQIKVFCSLQIINMDREDL